MGVQGLPGNQQALGHVGAAFELAAIDRPAGVHAVADDRVPEKAHVHAELMRPPGFGVEFHERELCAAGANRPDPPQHLVLRGRLLGGVGVRPGDQAVDGVFLAASADRYSKSPFCARKNAPGGAEQGEKSKILFSRPGHELLRREQRQHTVLRAQKRYIARKGRGRRYAPPALFDK